MSEKITWLMAVKNGMPFLHKTLLSIKAQQYSNFEIIVWDNGSTDGTIEELRSWIPHQLPGRLIIDQPLGLGRARAQLVKIAPTELCAISDSDDIHLPQRLERQVAFMQQHPDVALLGTNISLIDGHDKELPGVWSYPTDDAAVRWRIRFANAILQPTVMFRKTVALKAGNYFDISDGTEDYDLWMRMAAIARIGNLPERLVKYRRHQASISANRVNGAASPRLSGVLVNRQLVEKYASLLFPDTPEEIALRLHQVLLNDQYPVTLHDCLWLHRAATRAALAVGEASNYFRQTKRYSLQQRSLLIRLLKQQNSMGVFWKYAKRIFKKSTKSAVKPIDF